MLVGHYVKIFLKTRLRRIINTKRKAICFSVFVFRIKTSFLMWKVTKLKDYKMICIDLYTIADCGYYYAR